MKKPPDIYQVKVTLRDTRPPVWRRLLVRSDLTLFKLHGILQVAMGWTDSHLHQFILGRKRYSLPDFELDFGEPCFDERKVRLAEVLTKPKDKLVYEYDFGDGWLHNVVLEQVLAPEAGAKYPWVLAGKRACPPEDCGGIGGYENLVEVMRNPAHPEYQELVDWLGEPFDAEAFDPREANLALHAGWAPAK